MQPGHWYTDLTEKAIENKHIIDEYFDVDFTRAIIRHAVKIQNKVYFRPRFIGFDDLPKRNNPKVPLLYASNHSGMAFPWDAIIMAAGLHQRGNYGSYGLRPLASPTLSETRLMNPYLIPNLWKIVGSVDASFLNFETMMLQDRHNLLIYPEGVPGIGKGFNRRYQLQRFSSSFITMALKYKTDIIPVYTVNGEYINPYAYNWNWLNRLVNKIGVPYMPIGFATIILLLQPWFFYAAFPARLTYVKGERISVYKMVNKPLEEISLDELVGLKEQVRSKMQAGLNEARKQYGAHPWALKSFAKQFIKTFYLFPYNTPIGWPLMFDEFRRKYAKEGPGMASMKLGFLSTLRILFRRPFNFWFFIPIVGWLPILLKGMKRVRKRNPKLNH